MAYAPINMIENTDPNLMVDRNGEILPLIGWSVMRDFGPKAGPNLIYPVVLEAGIPCTVDESDSIVVRRDS